MLAEFMLNKKDNVVIVGLDDTKKSAGHKLHNIKADHIAIKGPKAEELYIRLCRKHQSLRRRRGKDISIQTESPCCFNKHLTRRYNGPGRFLDD